MGRWSGPQAGRVSICTDCLDVLRGAPWRPRCVQRPGLAGHWGRHGGRTGSTRHRQQVESGHSLLECLVRMFGFQVSFPSFLRAVLSEQGRSCLLAQSGVFAPGLPRPSLRQPLPPVRCLQFSENSWCCCVALICDCSSLCLDSSQPLPYVLPCFLPFNLGG